MLGKKHVKHDRSDEQGPQAEDATSPEERVEEQRRAKATQDAAVTTAVAATTTATVF